MRIISKQRLQPSLPYQGKNEARKGLSTRKVNDYLRFSLFLVLIGMAYIWNSYDAERQIKQLEEVRLEAKQLKSRYLLKQSLLSAHTRFSEIQQELDTLGLKPLRHPAVKIVKGGTLPLEKTEAFERSTEPMSPDTLTAPAIAGVEVHP